MVDLPQPVTRDQEFLAAMVGRLDAILGRLPELQPAKAADGGPVEVREPDPPNPPREVREPAKKTTPAKRATRQRAKG